MNENQWMRRVDDFEVARAQVDNVSVRVNRHSYANEAMGFCARREVGQASGWVDQVAVRVEREDDHSRTLLLSLDEAAALRAALDALDFAQPSVVREREPPSGGDGELADGEANVDGLVVLPVPVRRLEDGWGSVEGLDDEELADPFELERCVIRGHWPWWLLRLPSRKRSPGEPWFPD